MPKPSASAWLQVDGPYSPIPQRFDRPDRAGTASPSSPRSGRRCAADISLEQLRMERSGQTISSEHDARAGDDELFALQHEDFVIPDRGNGRERVPGVEARICRRVAARVAQLDDDLWRARQYQLRAQLDRLLLPISERLCPAA